LTRARRLIVTVTDISAERRQRDLLDMAVRSAGIGIWDWDMQRQATTFAPNWWAILGLPASTEAVNSVEWVQRVHPDDVVRAKRDLSAHVRDPGVAYRSELRVRHADGHWVWVHAAGAIVEARADGKPARMVGMHIDISDRKRLEVTLREAARTDSLTQLPNRAALMSHLDACIARSIAEPSRRFAVLFLDFDRFKTVNDTLGHEAGDELLRMVAARLRNTVRGADDVARFDSLQSTAARVGGDEFVVLLQGLDSPSDAERVAQRLLHVLAQPYVVGGHSVNSTASMGIAYSDDSGLEAETLLRDADIAMYEAKRRGRNRAVWFSADMRLRISETQDLEADLRTALATTGQLSNAYQPIVDLVTRRAMGVEALARWMHPSRGPVSPVEFIPVAEESMLILQLGLVVLRQACADFAAWRKALGIRAPAYVSVNLSRAQLRSGTLLADVKAALAAAQLEPEVLRLEITESLAMQDEAALAVLHQLRDAGVKLALDDFGTGYSSLASLDQFPIDMVKIDRSFVTRMVGNRYKSALVRSTAEVGAALDLIVVAEGIETEEQAAALVQQQCRFGQGYLFSRPLAAEPMAIWLLSNPVRIEAEPHAVVEMECQ
jgi:diguanylate cyclase (GGDEF)-like protein/PAS domain S-box-containing protein